MKIKFLLLFIVFSTTVLSDYIELRTGLTAKIDILDTIGCKIQFRRNGNIVQIAKEDISFIVCNAETLSYKNFTCTPDNANKKSNKVFEDSYSSEKVQAIIEKMKFEEGKIRDGLVYYCKQPIIETDFQCCWDEKFVLFENELKAKFKNIKAISHDDLYKLLKNGSDTNTIILPFSIKAVSDISKNYNSLGFGSHITTDYNPSIGFSSRTTRYDLSSGFVKAIFNLIIIDLKDNIILHNDTSDVSRNIYLNKINSKDDKEEYQETKSIVLEKVLLKSINSQRKKFQSYSRE